MGAFLWHIDDDIAWDFVPIDTDNDGSADDGYIVVGTAYSSTTGFDAFVIRLDANGDSIWGKTFDGGASPAQPDVAYAVEQTSTDSILICGSTKTNYFWFTEESKFLGNAS
ncbi:MAG: hypothetical protein LH473_01380 [Chitinophagales bacterium]|nr:hypothetical protein [Chitinophagales bacterium]